MIAKRVFGDSADKDPRRWCRVVVVTQLDSLPSRVPAPVSEIALAEDSTAAQLSLCVKFENVLIQRILFLLSTFFFFERAVPLCTGLIVASQNTLSCDVIGPVDPSAELLKRKQARHGAVPRCGPPLVLATKDMT